MIDLRLDRLAVLLGAGASVASGIASGQMFNKTVTSFLTPEGLCDSAHSHRIAAASGWVRFEQLIETLRETIDPRLLVLQYMETSWLPSYVHAWAVEALAGGAVVLTTNFDALIEIAYHRRFGQVLEQLVTPQDYDQLRRPVDRTPRLFKLHGSLRSSDYAIRRYQIDQLDEFSDLDQRGLSTVGATLDRVGYRLASDFGFGEFLLPEEILAVLEQLLRGRDLLVVGYSGSDDFDVMPSLRRLRPVWNRTLWIVHRSGEEMSFRTLGRFTRLDGDTPLILNRLFPLELNRPPLSITSDANASFAAFCRRWGARIEIDETLRHLVSGDILRRAGHLSNSIAVWEYGLDQTASKRREVTSKLYLRVGDAYLEEGSYVQAEETYELGSERCRETSNIPGFFAAQIGWSAACWYMGLVLHDPRFTHNAITSVQRFLDVRAEVGSPECDLRAVLTLVGWRRWSAGDRAVENLLSQALGQRAEFISALEGFSDSELLRKEKVLYARFLCEFALACFEDAHDNRFAAAERELFKLCDLLGLRLQRALYLLDLADLAARKDFARAAGLYSKASQLLRRLGCEVGAAEAAGGEALMSLQLGTPGAELLLKEAIPVFRTYRLWAKLAAAWTLLGGHFLFCSDFKRANLCLDQVVDATSIAKSPALSRIVGELRDCGPGDHVQTAYLLSAAWLEGRRRTVREGVAMAGWAITPDSRDAALLGSLLPPP